MVWRSVFVFTIVAILAACAQPAPNSDEACALVRRGAFTLAFPKGLPTITVQLDGKPATLQFDTGASNTTLTRSAAARLDLLRNGNVRVQSTAVGGASEVVPADIGRLQIGGVVLPNRVVYAAPFDLRGWGDTPPDGLLGNDILSLFDVEIDLKTGAGVLYRARNCASARPPWPLASQSFPISPNTTAGHVRIDVELDGRALVATIDTGAAATHIDRKSAFRMGVTEAALARDRSIATQGVSATDATARAHRFARLRVGNDVAETPELAVSDLQAGAGDMLIGMNYLRARKLWISLSSQRIDISAQQP